MTGRRSPADDEFDAIVERLDLQVEFPTDLDHEPAPTPRSEHRSEAPVEVDEPELDDVPDERDDQFYRRVDEGPLHLPRTRTGWVGLGVVSVPVLLVLCSTLGITLTPTVLVVLGISVVAGSVYLISQLPEHGPSRPDWPDDGAEL